MGRLSFLVTALAVITMLFAGVGSALAQDATPAGGPPAATFPDTMGLPELTVTITDTGFEGLPAETPAGRYLVNVNATAAEGGAAEFVMFPEGFDPAAFGAPPADATPSGEESGTPPASADPGEGPPPDFLFQSVFAGGTGGSADSPGQVILDLTPGEWTVWAGDPSAPQAPATLTVTGEEGATPAPDTEPAADVTITMFEYGFNLEGELGGGTQVVQVTNVGAQPHFIVGLWSSEEVTKEQIGQILELDATGATPAPDAGLPNPDEFVPVLYAGTISTGLSEWVPASFESGYLIVLCFFPDIESGAPHVAFGMYDVFPVGDTGTPAA